MSRIRLVYLKKIQNWNNDTKLLYVSEIKINRVKMLDIELFKISKSSTETIKFNVPENNLSSSFKYLIICVKKLCEEIIR